MGDFVNTVTSDVLTFEPLVFRHHPLKDHSHDLPDSGGRCVVGDVVFREVKSETQNDRLMKHKHRTVNCATFLSIDWLK